MSPINNEELVDSHSTEPTEDTTHLETEKPMPVQEAIEPVSKVTEEVATSPMEQLKTDDKAISPMSQDCVDVSTHSTSELKCILWTPKLTTKVCVCSNGKGCY